MSYDSHDHLNCESQTTLRNAAGGISFLSCIAVSIVIYCNVSVKSCRRYPARIVTFLGGSLFLFDLTIALGWSVGFKQLDYDSSVEPYDKTLYSDRFWRRSCNAQGMLLQVALVGMAAYATWISLAFFAAVTTSATARRASLADEGRAERAARRAAALKREYRLHGAIAMAAMGSAAVSLWQGSLGWNSGFVSCWVESKVRGVLFVLHLSSVAWDGCRGN